MRAIEHGKAHSNTGLVGITDSPLRGRPCLRVSWRAKKGVRKCTTIYYGGAVTRDEAIERAQELRRLNFERRMDRERRTL